MDITSLKENIIPNISFEYNGKKYFYNKIISYDSNLSLEINEGFYYNNIFYETSGIYTVECFFNINFGNEILKIKKYKTLHKNVYKDKIINKSFLGIKYNKRDYRNEYFKILFTKGTFPLKLKYYKENSNQNFHIWCLEKLECISLYNDMLNILNEFKIALHANNI